MRLKGLGRLRRALSRHLGLPRRRGLILLYHRVVDVETDPWSMCVTPGRFRQHLAAILEWGDPVALCDLRPIMEDGRSRRRPVALTFDDGYADNLSEALPLLERYGVPATVFACTGYLDGTKEFWWDQLEGLLLHDGPLPSELHLRVEGRSHRWRLDGPPSSPGRGTDDWRRWRTWQSPPSRRHALYRDLWTLLTPIGDAERTRVLLELQAWSGTVATVRPSHSPLSEKELAALAASPLVSIGAHTVSHSALSSLSAAEQRREIEENKRHLESIIGRAVTDFAYPFGRRRDYGRDTIGLVRDAGFVRACSNFDGAVRRGLDPWELPRLKVDDWDGEAFARRLDEWAWA